MSESLGKKQEGLVQGIRLNLGALAAKDAYDCLQVAMECDARGDFRNKARMQVLSDQYYEMASSLGDSTTFIGSWLQ